MKSHIYTYTYIILSLLIVIYRADIEQKNACICFLDENRETKNEIFDFDF